MANFNPGETLQGSFDERNLDMRMMNDIHEAFSTLPYTCIARDAFVSIVLRCPPEITMKTLKDWQMTDELRALMQMYWLPWNISKYDWIKQFEIAPFYFEKVRGTEHFIPVVPPYGSGRMTTFLDKQKKQQFRWYWANESKHDSRFYFDLGDRPPGLDGKIRSTMSSIIAEWGTLKIIRTAIEVSTEAQKTTRTLFEYHPPKNLHDDNLETLEAYGDKVAGSVMSQARDLETMKFKMSKQVLDWSLMQADAENRAKMGGTAKPNNRSDSLDKLVQRTYATMMSTGTPIPADFVAKTIPAPHVTADMHKIWERLDEACSAMMDIPLQLIESRVSRSNAAGVQGNMFIVNKRIKGWVRFFEATTKRAFLLTYGLILQEDMTRMRIQNEKMNPARMLELYVESEIEVHIPCTPIASEEHVKQLWKDGFMSKQRAAEHLFDMMGFSFDDIELSEYPDMYPKDLAAKELQLGKKTTKSKEGIV